MQRTQVDDELASERYLADQMTPQEAAEFEKLCSAHPDVYQQIEATLRLKEGLAVLQERGDLDRVLRARPRQPWIKAAAAVVVVSLLGVWAWRHHAAVTPSERGVSSLTALSTNRNSLPVVGSLLLVRSRGTAAEFSLPLPTDAGAIELRILPSEFVAHARYTVTLARLENSGAGQIMGRQSDLEPGPDRYLTVYLSSARVARGEYALSATPQSPGAETTERFLLRVK